MNANWRDIGNDELIYISIKNDLDHIFIAFDN